MPTPDECAAGYAPDVPLLVVTDGDINDQVFSAHVVELAFDDPHGQPAGAGRGTGSPSTGTSWSRTRRPPSMGELFAFMRPCFP
jgi:hypothetical protein